MKKSFKYSVLKYRPSYLLDERVNVGLLFYFEGSLEYPSVTLDDSKFVFIYPSSLSRISESFLNTAKLPDIKSYLKAFEKKANELSRKEISKNKSFGEIINDEFIIDDANSFFFSEVKSGFYTDVQKTLTYYKENYFKNYGGGESRKLPDSSLKETFYNSLNNLANANDYKTKLDHFKSKIIVDNIIGKTEFEYGWQNGSVNLIKTLSFDLTEENSIQTKAFKWASAINYLKEIANKEDLRFDIIVARPSRKNLFKSFDNALKVLGDIEAKKKIIEEPKIDDYIITALDTVIPYEIDFKSLE